MEMEERDSVERNSIKVSADLCDIFTSSILKMNQFEEEDLILIFYKEMNSSFKFCYSKQWTIFLDHTYSLMML